MSGDKPTTHGSGSLTGAGVTMAALPRRRRLGGLALVLGGSAAAVAAAFTCGFLVFVASIENAEREPAGQGDGIVALTGGAERIEDAIGLLSRGFGARLLITGVNERTSRESIARLTPGQRRLVECCVDLDYRARNTVGNALEISRWARERGFRSLVVVTSNYHLPRTLVELDEALPGVRKIPYAVVAHLRQPDSWAAQASRARLLLSEYAKFVAVWVRTRLSVAAGGGAPASGVAEPAPGR